MTHGTHTFRSIGLVSALLLTAALAACGEDGAGEAFTFADDDLCEWITADEVAEFYTSVYDWEGTAEVATTSDSGEDECRWRLTGPTDDEYDEISAGNADPGALLPDFEIVEYDGGTIGTPGGTVSDHPALSEGVVVQSAGWGFYTFWAPPREEYLSLVVVHHEGDDTTVVDSATDADTRAEGQTRFFEFADRFIQELGWAS